jgi:hypothetical protein
MTQSAAAASAPQDPPEPGGGAGKHPIAAHPLTAAIITILVAGSIICTLVVPIYASITPKVGDWPFFYFYLLAYMPVVAVALWIAMMLERRLRPRGATAGPKTEAGR